MDAHVQMAEVVRQACITAALQAYEDGGLSGLCHEGCWEYAVDAMRALPLLLLVQALLPEAESEEGGGRPGCGASAATKAAAGAPMARTCPHGVPPPLGLPAAPAGGASDGGNSGGVNV
jgi:hypothetical protein